MVDKKRQYSFIHCSDCGGTGLIKNKKCLKCKGIGTALYLQGNILYWGQSMDPSSIAFEDLVKKIKILFNIILAIVGLSGILLMAYYGFKTNFADFMKFDYWVTPTFEKLYFWFSLLVDLYLYYRLEQEVSAYNKVIHKVFDPKLENEKVLDWETIWLLKKKDLVDISLAYTPEAMKSVIAGWELSKHFGHDQVLRLHLFGVLSQFEKSGIIMARLGINFKDLKNKISRKLSKNIISRGGNPILSFNVHKSLIFAYVDAFDSHRQRVDLAELTQSLASPKDMGIVDSDDVEDILIDLELTYQKVINVVAWVRIQRELRENLQHFGARARYKPKSNMDRAMTAIATPILDQFSTDLTLKAKYGHLFPCIGREEEFDHIFRIMEGSRQAVILLGHQGVGRTTLIEGLAQKMAVEDVPNILQDKRLVSLDVSRLIAGTDASGAEQRLLMMSDEIIRSGNIVLAVENLHNLTGITSGNESSMDLSEVFAHILSKHSFYCIATTTTREYSKAIEGNSLDSNSQVVKVEELELNNAIWVLEAKSGPIEYQNKVYFSYDAIEKAATLSSRYIQDRFLPEKALEILEQAAAKVAKTKGQNQVVTGDDSADIVSSMTNIPLTKITETESKKLLNLENLIHKRMVNQNEAVDMVAASLRRARTELREGKRPIASLMFLGPTGVGKTELAKTVSEVYFGDENAMIRVDMSEFQDQQSLYRLIGQGSTPGLLTEPVRKKPFSMVLLDEIEKANSDILNILLQIMDDGRVTDSMGRVIDFTNTIIVMTSNAGAQFIQDEMKKGTNIETIKSELINEQLKDYYRPEFINRLDGLVVFKPLTMTDVIQIARLMVKKITANLEEKGILFEVTDEALAELSEIGFDPKFGARPLRRVIQSRIDDVLANHLLEGKIKRRDKVILKPEGQLEIVKAEEL